MTLPIRFEDALAARERLRPYLQPTPLRSYASFAGLRLLRERLAGRKVVAVLSGSNIDAETLRRVVNGEI